MAAMQLLVPLCATIISIIVTSTCIKGQLRQLHCSHADAPGRSQYLPHPHQCNKFIQCVNGVQHVHQCPDPLHWNERVQVCDYPEKAQCQVQFTKIAEEQNVSTTCNNGWYYAHERSCQKFYYCKQGVRILLSCAAGFHWHQRGQQCDNPQIAQCPHSRPMNTVVSGATYAACVEKSNVGHGSALLPHPGDCARFINCAGRRAWVMDCPRGLLWNDQRKRCDFAYNVKCLKYDKQNDKNKYIYVISQSEITPQGQITSSSTDFSIKMNQEHDTTIETTTMHEASEKLADYREELEYAEIGTQFDSYSTDSTELVETVNENSETSNDISLKQNINVNLTTATQNDSDEYKNKDIHVVSQSESTPQTQIKSSTTDFLTKMNQEHDTAIETTTLHKGSEKQAHYREELEYAEIGTQFDVYAIYTTELVKTVNENSETSNDTTLKQNDHITPTTVKQDIGMPTKNNITDTATATNTQSSTTATINTESNINVEILSITIQDDSIIDTNIDNETTLINHNTKDISKFDDINLNGVTRIPPMEINIFRTNYDESADTNVVTGHSINELIESTTETSATSFSVVSTLVDNAAETVHSVMQKTATDARRVQNLIISLPTTAPAQSTSIFSNTATAGEFFTTETTSASSATVATSTTVDPRLPFRAPQCQILEQRIRFGAHDCQQYYQCFEGYAYLLNCYEGLAFDEELRKCAPIEQTSCFGAI